jgi:hypothetical protein
MLCDKCKRQYDLPHRIYCFSQNEQNVVTETYFALNVFLKVEVVPVHDMKTYRVSRGVAPHLLNLGTRWRCLYALAD